MAELKRVALSFNSINKKLQKYGGRIRIVTILSFLNLAFLNCTPSFVVKDKSTLNTKIQPSAMGDGAAPTIVNLAPLQSSQSEATPSRILMTDYFPVPASGVRVQKLYRNSSNQVSHKQIIDSVDPRLNLISAGRPDSRHYVIHDYQLKFSDLTNPTQAELNSEMLYYASTAHMRNSPDGEVSEIARSFVPSLNEFSVGDGQVQFGRMNTFNSQVVGYGRPGGHIPGEQAAYLQNDILIWNYPETCFLAENSNLRNPCVDYSFFYIRTSWGQWSSSKLTARLTSFTPEYGAKIGAFAPANGQTYNDVIVVLFSRGEMFTGQNSYSCQLNPTDHAHVPGYVSTWQKLWLARGVGVIQVETLFDEYLCDGTLASDNPRFKSFIDESGLLHFNAPTNLASISVPIPPESTPAVLPTLTVLSPGSPLQPFDPIAATVAVPSATPVIPPTTNEPATSIPVVVVVAVTGTISAEAQALPPVDNSTTEAVVGVAKPTQAPAPPLSFTNYSLKGYLAGANTALDVSATITAADAHWQFRDIPQLRLCYYAAAYFSARWYFYNLASSSWSLYNPDDPTTTPGCPFIPQFQQSSGTFISGAKSAAFVGAQLFVGYGVGDNSFFEMLSAQRFQEIGTVPETVLVVAPAPVEAKPAPVEQPPVEVVNVKPAPVDVPVVDSKPVPIEAPPAEVVTVKPPPTDAPVVDSKPVPVEAPPAAPADPQPVDWWAPPIWSSQPADPAPAPAEEVKPAPVEVAPVETKVDTSFDWGAWLDAWFASNGW